MYIITTIWPHDTAAFSIWDLATSGDLTRSAHGSRGPFRPETTRSAEGRPVSLTTWHRRRQAWLEGKGGGLKILEAH